MNLRPHDLAASPTGEPTTVKEVDAQGNPTGTQYLSRGWTARVRPSTRDDGSPQWIDTLVVSDTVEGANAGAAKLPQNIPAASSSPYSRDVLVTYVNENGDEIKRFTMPYLTASASRPNPGGASDRIADVLLISQDPIPTPADYQSDQTGVKTFSATSNT